MAIAAAAGLVYVNSLRNGFALDDVPLVRENPALAPPVSWLALWTAPYWPETQGGAAAGLHRPVAILSFALNRALFGAGPLGFHAVNVGIHAAVALMAAFVLYRIARSPIAAIAAGFLLAVHPLRSEAVANIAGRSELLAAAGVLGAWLLHARSRETDVSSRRALWLALAAASWGLAALSKESAVLAPLLFVLDDLLKWRKGGPPPAIARALVAYGGAAAGVLVLRIAALGSLEGPSTTVFLDNPAAFAGPLGRFFTATWVHALYLARVAYPVRLSSDWSFDAIPVVTGLSDARAWLGILSLALVAVAFAFGWRHSRPIALAAASWILLLLPGSNLAFASGTIMAERLTYLPVIGPCLLLGQLLSRSGRARWAITVVAVVALSICFAARTVQRNRAWYDNATLAAADVVTVPRSAKLHAGAAIASHLAGDRAAAERAYRAAIAIWPDYAQSHFNLAQLLLDERRDGEALPHLEAAARLAPQNPQPWKSLAPLLDRAGRREDALAAWSAGIAADPADLALRLNFARALVAHGLEERATDVLGKLVAEAPESAEGRFARALLHEIHGRFTDAAATYRELLADPAFPERLRRRIRTRLDPLDGPGGP